MDKIKQKIKLTERELMVLNLMLRGMSNKEIGKSLFISVHTVKACLEVLYRKFNVHNRVQLVVYAAALGFISLDNVQDEL